MRQATGRRKLLIVSSIVILLMGYLLVKLFWGTFINIGIDKEYYQKMESITIGMTEDEVIKLLGPPATISNEPEITQYHGDKKLYGKAIKNRNKVLIYQHGIDITGHYFINAEGKVYFVNVGGT